jgi:hypothetical protein
MNIIRVINIHTIRINSMNIIINNNIHNHMNIIIINWIMNIVTDII